MHIPDGFLTAPVAATAMAASGAVLAAGVYRARKTMEESDPPLLAVTAAFVFAAQMVNFPVGAGTSGHFMGSFLCASLMGPLNAVLIIGMVLFVQALLFADGGISALGANLLNMGVVGGLLSYALFLALKKLFPAGRKGYLAAAGGAAWFSVVMAACLCAVELWLSGMAPLNGILPAMAGVHAVIGIGEALITAAVLGTVLNARPDLVRSFDLTREGAT